MTKHGSKKLTIELTIAHFKILLKSVYLGEWMANAFRTDDRKKEYELIQNLVFSHCKDIGLEKYVSHEESDGSHYYPTADFEESMDVDNLIEEYNDDLFWDELAERLGEKEFFKKYSKEEILNMNEVEWYTKLYECIGKFYNEFAMNGLDRLGIEEN